MAIVGAVTPGVHLPDLARTLTGIHTEYLEGRTLVNRPRDVVVRSWQRVLALGLSADGSPRHDPMETEQLYKRREASRLTGVVGELAQLIGDDAERSHMLLVVTDADGVVLWREGSARVRHRADSFGFFEGATWTEERVGTNAIGTALAEAAPVQLFSAEHFERAQHAWYCTASPIHDPVSGRLLGVLDVSGPAFSLHPAVTSLVEAARRLVEARLMSIHEQSLDALRRMAEPILTGSRGPAVVVDEDGWVALSRGVGVGRRVPIPTDQHTVHVPGLGQCHSERVAHGWLLRPESGVATRLDVHLMHGDSPYLEISGDGETWRTGLTGRHADILLLLYKAGAQGLSAAALSRALYGDAEHIVTVRAEISRLRRTVGSVMSSNPYRFTAGIRVTSGELVASSDRADAAAVPVGDWSDSGMGISYL